MDILHLYSEFCLYLYHYRLVFLGGTDPCHSHLEKVYPLEIYCMGDHDRDLDHGPYLDTDLFQVDVAYLHHRLHDIYLFLLLGNWVVSSFHRCCLVYYFYRHLHLIHFQQHLLKKKKI